MKKILILSFFSLLFLASTCQKEGEDCHRRIKIINNSTDSIIIAFKGYYGSSGLCNLAGSILKTNDTYELTRNVCWESILANGQSEEIYIVDPNNFNEPGAFYDCDSIEIKNTVLKLYVLSLEDLKKNKFTVTYP